MSLVLTVNNGPGIIAQTLVCIISSIRWLQALMFVYILAAPEHYSPQTSIGPSVFICGFRSQPCRNLWGCNA